MRCTANSNASLVRANTAWAATSSSRSDMTNAANTSYEGRVTSSGTTGHYDQTTTNLDTHHIRSVTNNPDQPKRSPLPDQLPMIKPALQNRAGDGRCQPAVAIKWRGHA